MYLVCRYRGAGGGGGSGGATYRYSELPCCKNLPRICLMFVIVLSLTLGATAFSALEKTKERIIIGSVLLIVGFGLMFCMCLVHLIDDVRLARRRAQFVRRREQVAMYKDVDQILENYRRWKASEGLLEVSPPLELRAHNPLGTQQNLSSATDNRWPGRSQTMLEEQRESDLGFILLTKDEIPDSP